MTERERVVSIKGSGKDYLIILNDMKMKPALFKERSEAFCLEADPYMGVCLSNKELHTVMIDVEDRNRTTMSFNKEDKGYVENILSIVIV